MAGVKSSHKGLSITATPVVQNTHIHVTLLCDYEPTCNMLEKSNISVKAVKRGKQTVVTFIMATVACGSVFVPGKTCLLGVITLCG